MGQNLLSDEVTVSRKKDSLPREIRFKDKREKAIPRSLENKHLADSVSLTRTLLLHALTYVYLPSSISHGASDSDSSPLPTFIGCKNERS